MIVAQDGHVNPSHLLRRLADALEAQHNQQNNQLGAALGNAELGLENRLDDLQRQIDSLASEIASLKERAVGCE
jgi:peptidoglycan hydrolase CwlO-like protein